MTSEEEWLIFNLYTRFLERCYPSFRDQVSVHLAIPASLGPFCFDQDKLNEWTNASLSSTAQWTSRYNHNRWSSAGGGPPSGGSNNNNRFNLESILQSAEEQPCDKTRDYMMFLLQAFPVTQKEKLRFKEVYPQNHMRNIARKVSTIWKKLLLL